MSGIALANKATSGIGVFLAGMALDMIAFPTGVAPSTVPPDKVLKLGLIVGPGLTVLYILSLIFVSQYRLTRERHRTILAVLAEKREKRGHSELTRV